MVELLISKGGRIDSTTRDGLTPLHCAARNGNEEVINILLTNNSPILSKTKVNFTFFRKFNFSFIHQVYFLFTMIIIIVCFRMV